MGGIRSVAFRRALLWAATAFVWSCSSTTETDSSGGDGVASIVVTPPTPTVAVGAEVPLHATAQDASGNAVSGVSVVWTVQDSRIAKVSSAGVVTGLAIGTTQVAANANGKSGIAAITVQKTPVASVVVLPKRVDATPGVKTPLTGIAYDASQNALTDRTIIWTTSNELVATVDATGLVTAVAPGTATITGTVEGKSDAATVVVTQAPIATVAVSPNPLQTSVRQSTQLSAIALDSSGNILTGRPVAWSSSNTAVATIDAQGMLTAVAAGTTTITATSEGKTGTGAVTVSNFAVGTVSVQPNPTSVVQNSSVQLTAVVRDVTGEITQNRAVTWNSSNNAIATVSTTGLVKGIASGSVNIVATSEGQTGAAAVTVTPAPVSTVTIQPPSASVTAGKTTTLTAATKDANGNTLTGRTITWSSSNTSIATVSDGVVTGVAIGVATITATSEGKSATANVNVLAPILAVGTVSVAPPSPNLMTGQTANLTATVKDVSGTVVTDRAIAWTSSNNNVATVSSTGTVTAVGAGTATITATSEGKTGTSTVTVTSVPVGSVSVAPPAPSVAVGATTQLVATVKDQNGTTVTDRVVTWSSSANTIATVSQAGVVTGVAVGTATITATSEGKRGTSTVSVVPVPVGSVTLTPSSNPLFVGQSAQLTATVKDQNGTTVTNRVVTWGSSNNTIAAVSATGQVTAVAPGTATITATSEGKSGTATVVVTVPVGSVTVAPSSPSVLKGSTTTLTATVKDQNGVTVTDRPVTWSSNNDQIATVSSAGVVTGIGAGTATITATSETKSGTSTVTVTLIPVGSVTVTPATTSVPTGQSTTLDATVKDQNGLVVTDRAVVWSSSAPLTASVNQSGVVQGLLVGTATITATSEGKSGSSVVTVTLIPVATVTVAPSPATVAVGSTTQLTATTKDLLGGTLTGRTIAWSTGNAQIATVSSTGLVTGVAAGSTTITATSEGKTGSATVNVTLPPVNTVTVQPSPSSVFVAFTQSFTAVLKDANGNTLTGRVVSWQSSNTNVATISASGVVTGVAPGTSTITATSEGKSGTSTLTVTLAPVATVTVTPSPVSVAEGATIQLTATLKDANGNVLTGRTISWSSNSGNATVNASGLVTGKHSGSATITATSEGVSGTSAVTVTK